MNAPLALGSSALCLGLLLSAGPARAAPDLATDYWEAHLRVTDGASTARVSFGVRPTATEGHDVLWDVPALWGSGIRAWFDHPDWPGGPYFVRDVQGAPLPRQFELSVASVPAGRTVTVTWQLQWVPTGCERVDLELVDPASGRRVDLRRTGAFTYVSRAGETRRLVLEAKAAPASPRPAPPRITQAVRAGRSGMALLKWDPPPGDVWVAGYNVYRLTEGGAAVRANEKPVHDTRFQDRAVPDGARGLGYQVRALNGELCEGPPSPDTTVRGGG